MVPNLIVVALVSLAQDSVRTGDPFALPIGESASLEDADLVLRFSTVTSDSRCPRDVNCIVAGEAVVVFDATSAGESVVLRFRIPPGGADEAELAGFRIAVVELLPEPVSGKRTDPRSYVATVVVEPASR